MVRIAPVDALLHDDIHDEVMTGEAVGLDLRPTSYVLAAAGAIIDWLVYFVGGLLLFTLVIGPLLDGVADSATAAAISTLSGVLILIVIPMTVEVLSRGKSLGRLAVGARIVRDDGGAIGFRHAFIRALASVLEIYATFGGMAALVGILNSRSKRLGDLLAGTYSQYERVARDNPPVYGVPVELVQWAATADVARMPDRLHRRITQFLRTAGGMTPDARTRVSRELASEASPWVSPLPHVSAELFLAGLAALRRDREYTALALEHQRLAAIHDSVDRLPHRFPDRD